MKKLQISLGLNAALFLLILSGCGSSDGPATYPVSGTVTFDGQPVPSGQIIFESADGQTGSAAGKIEQGKFSCRTVAGQKRVKVLAVREVPGKFDESNPGERVPLKEMYIPARYYAQTELTAEVTPDGQNRFDFSLSSK